VSALRRIVVTWMATAYGGAEKSSLELCRTIRQRFQVEVTLVMWHYGEDGKFTLDVQQPNVVHCFNIDEYRQCLAAALSVDALSTVMFSNHRTYQLDLELAEQSGVPTAVIFRQTPIADEALRTLASPVSAELTYLHGDELDWDSLHRAAALVGISNFGARGIARFAEQHRGVVRIYNGLQMPGEIGRVTARDVRRFLIVARLINWKAVDFGIEAFTRLSCQYPDVRLQIAGDGEEAARLRQLTQRLQASAKVEFLGFVSDIRSVYLDNDCLLHLSGIESFGRVVVEAALCGLAVVVPQSAGTGEVVINEHTGLTFAPSDLSDCVRAMERAYHLSENDYLRLASAARQRALAMFNLERLAEEYVGLANSMLHQQILRR